MSLPNLITLLRILLVPVIFWLMATGRMQLAFFTFVIAGLSDAMDGFLAKQFDQRSELGAYLDPLADKLLIVSVFIAMGASGALPLWLVIAVVTRDILIIAAVILAWLLHNPVRIAPLFVSKANTSAQIGLAALVLAHQAFELPQTMALSVLIWVTGVLTVASLAAYMRAWLTHMQGAAN